MLLLGGTVSHEFHFVTETLMDEGAAAQSGQSASSKDRESCREEAGRHLLAA